MAGKFHIGLLGHILMGVLLIGIQAKTATAQNRYEHSIGKVEGRVMVKRTGWKDFVPATTGMLVTNGDLVRLLDSSAKATVVCADSSVREVPQPLYPVQCGNARPVIRFKKSLVSGLRSGPGSEFPALVSPRMTKLVDPRPVLRWTGVPGATTYHVAILHEGTEYWSQDIAGATELRYPGVPELRPGDIYQLVIQTRGLKSTLEKTPNLGFTVLGTKEAQDVRSSEKKIRDLSQPAPMTSFLIANLFATWGLDLDHLDPDKWPLNAEAIEILENSSRTQPIPASLRMLGDLYLTIGLSRLAEDRYGRALSLSETTRDIQGQALANLELARIFNEVRFNTEEAIKHLQKARDLFATFDESSAKEAEAEIAALQTGNDKR